MREIPNSKSKILSKAVIAGVGLAMPPNQPIPPGIGVVVLLVPLNMITGQSIVATQNDLGLPWYSDGGPPVWLDEHIPN